MSTSSEYNSSDYNYDVVMSINKGKYYFHIKELQILGCGDDLNSAYKDLTNKKEILLTEFQNGENLNELPKVSKKSTTSFLEDFGQIRIFLIKLLIIIFIGALGLSFAKEGLDNSSSYITQTLTQGIRDKVRISKLGKFFMIQLDDAAKNEITPEMEKQIIKDIRILVKKLQPYADELRPLLNSDENGLKPRPN